MIINSWVLCLNNEYYWSSDKTWTDSLSKAMVYESASKATKAVIQVKKQISKNDSLCIRSAINAQTTIKSDV